MKSCKRKYKSKNSKKIKKHKQKKQYGGNNLQILKQNNNFLSQTELNEMYQLMFDVHHFLKKFNIKYVSVGGTLIGLIRNKSILPWDDDLDIAVDENDMKKIYNLEPILNQYGYSIIENAPTITGIKIYKTNNPRIKNLGWDHISGDFEYSWPFIDVFTFKINNDKVIFNNYHKKPKCFIYKSDLFPIKSYKFSNFSILGPNNPYPFLNECFGYDWNTKAKIYRYNHRLEWYNDIKIDEIDMDNSLRNSNYPTIKLKTNFN